MHKTRLLELLVLAFVLLEGAGFFYATRFEDFLGYSAVLFTAIAPVAIWIRAGVGGLPILPCCAILYWIYFAVPTLRGAGESTGYSPEHVLDADLTVAMFLFLATVVWTRFLRAPRSAKPSSASQHAVNRRAVLFLVTFGLGLGVSFSVIAFTSLNHLLGNAIGIIRAASTAPLILACYFLGYGRAKRMFSSVQWIIALAALATILVLQIGGLVLITGITEVAAALIGYIYTARKVPWITVLLMTAVLSVFQAGKGAIRDRYSDVNMTAELTPVLFSQWFEIGLDTLQHETKHASVADRATLLPQMIRIQQWTPSHVPYLEGETYTYLPAMLVPRIINPNRAATQVVMNMLDVRYGFLTAEQTKETAVGVNIVPEAFANFGYIGVGVLAILFGIFTGYFTRLSLGQDATSLPTLLAIAVLVTVIDLEADLSYLVSMLYQTCLAVAVFHYGLHFVFGTRRSAMA